MNRALTRNGAPGQLGKGALRIARLRRGKRGFTLLEMVMVLLIMAVLAGITMPAIGTAFTEQGMRHDSHELALMVRTAMIQASEQHRSYVVDVTASTLSLHPAGRPTTDDTAAVDSDNTNAPASSGPVAAVEASDAEDSGSPMEDVTDSETIDASTNLQIPDPKKQNAWIDIPATSWVFLPGELCPVPRVRMARGDNYIEMSFNALTGNVQDELSSIR